MEYRTRSCKTHPQEIPIKYMYMYMYMYAKFSCIPPPTVQKLVPYSSNASFFWGPFLGYYGNTCLLGILRYQLLQGVGPCWREYGTLIVKLTSKSVPLQRMSCPFSVHFSSFLLKILSFFVYGTIS